MRGFIILMVIGLIIIGSAMSALMAGGISTLFNGGSANPSLTYYSNVNFTETGINFTTYPALKWGGQISQQSLNTITFSTGNTYDNVSVGSDFPTTATFVMSNLGPFNTNDYYTPSPDTGVFGSFSSVGNTLFVHVTYTLHSGYFLNVTEYSLPAYYNFTGMITNRLSPNNITYYFSTTSNYLNTILPNGTWFMYVNSTTVPNTDVLYVPATSPIVFSIAGSDYALTVQFLDKTPGQQFLTNFHERGLATGTNWSVIVNGTQYYSNLSTISIFLPAGDLPFFATAVGYDYIGNSSVLIETPGGNLNVTFANSTEPGIGGTLADMLNPIGISVSGFLVAVSLGITMFTAGFVYAVTRHEAMMAATMAVIPWILYGIGFIGLAVPFYFILVAVAAYVAPKLLPGGLST